MKGCVFFGSRRVLLQERKATADGVRVKGVVSITERHSSLFGALYSTRVPVSSPRKHCAVSPTHKPWASKSLLDFHTARSWISQHRKMLLRMRGKRKSPVGAHEAQEVQAAVAFSGHDNLSQHSVMDPTWFHQVDFCELMMTCQ